ncbi:hypothetical protein J1N35_019556 [Gossypium stocksii]|uniref:RNase H type-1 domain-containing protein n=1 Tax=Gossypium stocksii TaxID=47602 RepID=A0A9D3VRI4_9ROSI|nr:hypothetical protein J1N35_019556 [Gossypium stocksii]
MHSVLLDGSDRSVLCSYIHDIKTLSRVFEEWQFKKVFRSGNGVAHELAKEAVTSLSTDLDYRLPRKALMALEEDVRHQAAIGGEKRSGNRVLQKENESH